jgi:uncharacterized protein YabN with tetrapyrrole methylase and pyrophosphatase domain
VSKLKGSLTIVGSGIKFAAHLTHEAKSYVKTADLVLHIVSDHVTEEYLSSLNSNCENLIDRFYKGTVDRSVIYEKMAQYIAEKCFEDQNVCAIFYGHPGVFVCASHRAIELVNAIDGYSAIMLPAISAEDCLFADLLVDPGVYGCQQFEVNRFLCEKRQPDTFSDLILWQIGSLGNYNIVDKQGLRRSCEHLSILKKYLLKYYPPTHQVTFYVAAFYPDRAPLIDIIKLEELDLYQSVGIETTLFVPHLGEPTVDLEMMSLLNLK